MAANAIKATTPRSAEVAQHRKGEPSPLAFYLGAALSGCSQALAAEAPAERLDRAAEVAERLNATWRGLEIWQTHPYRRSLEPPEAVWAQGCSRLIDYGAAPEAADAAGPPVLVVPSLINRAYILDLAPDRSMLRWLAGRGLRPMLLDWGEPGPPEAGFGLEDYGARRLLPALRAAQALAGRPVAVMGYCMGGALAAGLASRAPDGVSALVTIGAPWDFASTEGVAGGMRAAIRAQGPQRAEALIAALGQAFGLAPVSLFQLLFALIDPLQAALKFQKLARMDPEGTAARRFVALEDWLADGVPMPAPAARDLLIGWQIRNATAAGTWRFLGGAVDPRAIDAPACIVCGRSDLIAPPPLAEPLARAIPGARMIRPRTGHVGMIVGGGAPAQVWRPIAEFLGRTAR